MLKVGMLPCAAVAVLALLSSTATAEDKKGVEFEVVYDAAMHPGPLSTRVYVMLGRDGGREPRFGPNWFQPQPFFAVDAKDWKPGEPLLVGGDAMGFPGPLNTLKAGTYAAQAVVRLNPDTAALGNGEGNGYGAVVQVEVDPEKGGVTKLTIDRRVPPRPFPETERIKLVDIPSPMLSAFYHRSMRMQAAVILPEGGLKEGEKRPTLYIVPGFGGTHYMAQAFAGQRRLGMGEELIRVVLNPDCGTGHHVFADSATNGPRGRALIEELIPYIESHFPCVAEPGARLLTGHSSGGWSTLWLQVTYPAFFGGTWSTSPDPVDFRDFQRINLYASGENMFHDREGNRRPLARIGERPVVFYEDFSRMEDVLGDGGQLRSFEAVFSHLGPDGQARRLWNRKTGDIDPEVARSWEAYDIRLVLERNWRTLGPKLNGKLHVITGELDTFYLEGAVKLLQQSLQALGSDAVVEVIPGKDHSNVLNDEMAQRLDKEMNAAVAKYKTQAAEKTPAAAGN